MADNFVTNPAAGGDTFAADDIAGVKWQRVKLGQGVDGSATDVSSANPLPVDTELPAAAALDDATANPTAPMVGAAGMVWDGANWERQGTVPNFTAVSPYRAAATLPLVMNGAGNVLTQMNAAAVSDGEAGNNTVGAQGLYNGSSFDRQRGNTEGVALASAARTTTTQSELLTNHNARGMIVYLQVTSAPANTETLTVYLSAWYPDSSAFAYVATGMIITGNEGPKMIAAMYAPGLATSADVIDASTGSRFRKTYNMIVPRSVFVTVFHSAGSSWTYSVNYSLTV